MNVHNHTIEI